MSFEPKTQEKKNEYEETIIILSNTNKELERANEDLIIKWNLYKNTNERNKIKIQDLQDLVIELGNDLTESRKQTLEISKKYEILQIKYKDIQIQYNHTLDEQIVLKDIYKNRLDKIATQITELEKKKKA